MPTAARGAPAERRRVAPPGANLALRSPHLRAGASAWSFATSDPTASTLQPRPVPYARFFWHLPFALPWSHLFTLPSLPVTHRSPSLLPPSPILSPFPSLLTLHLSPGRLLKRTPPTEMLQSPRPGSAPGRTLRPPLPPPRGRGTQVSAPSFPQ